MRLAPKRLEIFCSVFYCGLSHRLDGKGYPRKGQCQEEPGPTLRCPTPNITEDLSGTSFVYDTQAFDHHSVRNA